MLGLYLCISCSNQFHRPVTFGKNKNEKSHTNFTQSRGEMYSPSSVRRENGLPFKRYYIQVVFDFNVSQ